MSNPLSAPGDPGALSTPRRVFICRPGPTAMQSAPGRQPWTLTFDSTPTHIIDSVTGWSGGGGPQLDVALTFQTLREAVDYAQRHNLPYEISRSAARSQPPPLRQTFQMRQVRSGAVVAPARPPALPDLAKGEPRRLPDRDIVAEAGEESFPASDPPAWTGVTGERRAAP